MKDLTVGHPGKVLLAYTLPLFGSVIFQQLYNLADSLVAGQYIGTQALAAVGNSYEITLIYIAFAFGCNVGASVVTARLFGQKAYADVRTAVHTALIFAAAMGVVLAIAGISCSHWMLTMIRTPQELMRDSADYLNIYLLGYLFLMLYQVSTGIFSALGDSKTPFWFLAVSSVSNIFVDIVFVRDLHLGVKGVAYATFLCQSISGVVALWAVVRKVSHMAPGKGGMFSWLLLRKILCVAVPSAVQQSFISVGNIMIQGVINGFGTAATGGYAAAIKLNNMTITSVTALGNGISNYTSQNLGAGKHERVQAGVRHGVLIGVLVALLFTAVYQTLCGPLLGLFITEGAGDEAAVAAKALSIGTLFIRMITPFYAVVAIKLTVDGALRGGGEMTPFMIATMTDLVLRVALCYLLSPAFGIAGVWMAWPIGWIVGTAVSCVMYGRWKKTWQAWK